MPVFLGIVALLVVGYFILQASSSASGMSGTASGNLTSAQIQGYASAAGFTEPDLDTAVAVAQAESSGNPSAIGDTDITPGGSIGLWQINLQAHPEYTQTELLDPQTNANAAYAIYVAAGNAFSPWSTYNDGSYQQYLPGASTSASSTSDTSSASDDTSEIAAAQSTEGGADSDIGDSSDESEDDSDD